MKFNVTVDLASKYFEIEAETKEEAERLALNEFWKLPLSEQIDEAWVGECDEVEE